MIVEIFTALARQHLIEVGGVLGRTEVAEGIVDDLAAGAIGSTPEARINEALSQVLAGGPLIATGDLVADLTVVGEHVAFTHRITAEEIAEDRLDLDADLAVIARLAESDGGLHRADGDPLALRTSIAPGAGPAGATLRRRHLAGPRGWLGEFGPDTIVVATAADGFLTMRPLVADEPAPTEAQTATLAEHLRNDMLAAVAEANGGDGSPVPMDSLQATGMVLGWHEPGPDRPPFGEIVRAAGLETSGSLVADPGAWERYAAVETAIGVIARHVDHLEEREATALSEFAKAFSAWREDPSSTPDRATLARLHRMPEACLCLEEELVRADGEGTELAGFLDQFDRPAGTVSAVLDTFRALAADLQGETESAIELLEAARNASPDWFPATEALAHLLELEGRAAEALNLLQTTRSDEDLDLQVLRLRNRLGSPSIGRNDPCPCGSGRKFKQCHQGQSLLPPEVRVAWVLDKARSHVNRFGPMSVTDRLLARTDLHPDAEVMALDMALFHYDGLARFVAARRPLLPADESALVDTWLTDNRPGLYRVVGGDYGEGASATDAVVVLVDIETDEVFQVRGPGQFDQSFLADVVWCRLLPENDHWWTSGFVRTLEGDDVDLLAAAMLGDEPLDLLGALLGMPVSVRVAASDGAPLVKCSMMLDIGGERPDAEAVLDESFERDPAGGWVLADNSHHVATTLDLLDPLDANITLPGVADDPDAESLFRLNLVASSSSIPRHARLVAWAHEKFPDASIVHEAIVPHVWSRALGAEEDLLEGLSDALDDEPGTFT